MDAINPRTNAPYVDATRDQYVRRFGEIWSWMRRESIEWPSQKMFFDDIVDRFLAANPAIRDKGKDQKKLYTVLYEHGRFAKADLARAASASSGAAAASSGAAAGAAAASSGAAGAAAPTPEEDAIMQRGLKYFKSLTKSKQLDEIRGLRRFQGMGTDLIPISTPGKIERLNSQQGDRFIAMLEEQRKW